GRARHASSLPHAAARPGSRAPRGPYTDRVSDQPPDGPEGQSPFGPGGFDLSEIFRMLQSPGPVNWELAREIAQNLAAGDPETGDPRDDPPVDPTRADSLLSLVRAAQTHVASATGLTEAAAV